MQHSPGVGVGVGTRVRLLIQPPVTFTIRIFNGCEVLTENSVMRVTVRHHKACRVMPNSYPSNGIFNLHLTIIMDSFSCILFLRQLHLDLNMCCFINFTLKYLHFSIKKSLVRLLSYMLTSKRLAKLMWKWRQDVKNEVKIVILTSCTRVVLHLSCKTTFPSPSRFQKSLLGMQEIFHLSLVLNRNLNYSNFLEDIYIFVIVYLKFCMYNVEEGQQLM